MQIIHPNGKDQMAAVTETEQNVSPLVTAALLLAARTAASGLGLNFPSASEVLEITGVGRSRAYEIAKAIPEAVAELIRPQGRPPLPTPTVESSILVELSRKVIAFLVDNPGCTTGGTTRRRYTDGFRHFILELIEEYSEVDLTVFAETVMVPLPTLRDWLRGGRTEITEADDELVVQDEVATAHINTIVDEWGRWKGDFVPFCKHIKENRYVPYGRTLISNILEMLGLRIPNRRPGRSPDEKALRGAFETFFPGAQWEGDGSPIDISIFGQKFVFNLELIVDADSGSVVGFSLRDHEDAEAVRSAFAKAVETTGGQPIVLELDGKPCNHTADLNDDLDDTEVMPSSPGRPQTNPHVEGAFGLFQQSMPPLVIEGTDEKEIAQAVLSLIVTIFMRALNNRPRHDRGGRSRAQLYHGRRPSPEEIERARAELRERCRRQELARQTRKSRGDPVRREMLDQAFQKLGLDDPRGNVRSAIARYPIDYILAAIATFEAKAEAGTLPKSADARYLFGITKNISNKDEGLRITEALLRLRCDARERMLAPLLEAHRQLLESLPVHRELLRAMIDNATAAPRQLDRVFWLERAAKCIIDRPDDEHNDLLRAVSRRIHSTFAIPYAERLAAVRFIARKVSPL